MSLQPNTSARIQKPKRSSRFCGLSQLSIVLAMLVVLPPWILVAIPGQAIYGGMGAKRNVRQHGWPFVHQWTFSAPKGLDSKWAQNELDDALEYQKNRVPFFDWIDDDREFIWMTRSENNSGVSISKGRRFWSDSTNWPSIFGGNNKHHSAVEIGGLIGNVLFCITVTLLFATILEFRFRKRKSHFKVSLLEFCLAITLFGIVFGIVANEHHRSKKEQAHIEAISGFDGSERGWEFTIQRRTPPFPKVIFHLFDRRLTLPWDDTPLFMPVQNAMVSTDIAFGVQYLSRDVSIEDLVAPINDASFPITLKIGRTYLVKRTQKFLDLLDREKVNAMEVRMPNPNDSSVRHFIEEGEKDWAVLLPIPNDFPNLKVLTVHLNDARHQGPQLERIAQIHALKDLESLEIFKVHPSGKAWLDENKDRLPDNVTIRALILL